MGSVCSRSASVGVEPLPIGSTYPDPQQIATVMHKLKLHGAGAASLARLGDGRVVSAGLDGGVASLRPYERLAVAVSADHVATYCLTLPDGRIVTGSDDAALRVISPSSEPQLLQGHEAAVTALAAVPHRNALWSGSADSSIRVWSLETLECLFVLNGHSSAVSAFTPLADGRFVSGGEDSNVVIWTAAGPTAAEPPLIQHTLMAHSAAVTALAEVLDPSTTGTAASGGGPSTSMLASPPSRGSSRPPSASPGRPITPSSASAATAAAAGAGGGHPLTMSPGSSRSTTGGGERSGSQMQILSASSRSLPRASSSGSMLAIYASTRLVSASKDGTLRVWDTGKGFCIATLTAHRGAVTCLLPLPPPAAGTPAAAAGGAATGMVCSGGVDGVVRVWRVPTTATSSTPVPPLELLGHTAAVTGMCLLAGGQMLVSVSADGSARIWEWATGACIAHLPDLHVGGVTHVVAIPDGDTVLPTSPADGGSLSGSGSGGNAAAAATCHWSFSFATGGGDGVVAVCGFRPAPPRSATTDRVPTIPSLRSTSDPAATAVAAGAGTSPSRVTSASDDVAGSNRSPER